jgi:hypothetical protein
MTEVQTNNLLPFEPVPDEELSDVDFAEAAEPVGLKVEQSGNEGISIRRAGEVSCDEQLGELLATRLSIAEAWAWLDGYKMGKISGLGCALGRLSPRREENHDTTNPGAAE